MLKSIQATQNKNVIGKGLFHLQAVSDLVLDFKANNSSITLQSDPALTAL